MKMGLIIGVAFAALACIGGWWYWRARRQRESRHVSVVALLRKPVKFSPAVVAKAAGKVWNADLGDGSTGGKDGFVAGDGPTMIMHDGRAYLNHCWDKPYVDDPAEAAEALDDLRIQKLFSEHRAWIAFDALGVDGTTPDEKIAEEYRRIARLLAEFLDDNCLLIYVPDMDDPESGRAYPINDETKRCLQSADPLAALANEMTVPITAVAEDDPLMQKAVASARKNWPQFIAAFEAAEGEGFSVKAPVTHSGNTEFIWLTVTALEGGRIFGELANDPSDLGPLKLGSKVSVNFSDLNDWCYSDSQGNLQGLYTVSAVQKASRRPKR